MEHSSTIVSPMASMATMDIGVMAMITMTMSYLGIMAMEVTMKKNLTGGLMLTVEQTLHEPTLCPSGLRFVHYNY